MILQTEYAHEISLLIKISEVDYRTRWWINVINVYLFDVTVLRNICTDTQPTLSIFYEFKTFEKVYKLYILDI